MGCVPLFCCFKNCQPKSIAITALIANVLAVIFLIWGVADLEFLVMRSARKALYIIAFVLFILLLILVIIVFILLFIRTTENYLTLNKIGKLLCIIIIVLSILCFIFLLIAWILVLVDYSDIEKILPGRQIPGHDWAAAIIPGIIGLIASIVIALCANVMYTIFNDNIVTPVIMFQTATPVNQQTITTVPNITTNPVIITQNNPGVIPPIIPNNKPVVIQ